MSDTPKNDDLMLILAGRPDAEHLVALDALSRRLERENIELHEKMSLMQEREHNPLSYRNDDWS